MEQFAFQQPPKNKQRRCTLRRWRQTVSDARTGDTECTVAYSGPSYSGIWASFAHLAVLLYHLLFYVGITGNTATQVVCITHEWKIASKHFLYRISARTNNRASRRIIPQCYSSLNAKLPSEMCDPTTFLWSPETQLVMLRYSILSLAALNVVFTLPCKGIRLWTFYCNLPIRVQR